MKRLLIILALVGILIVPVLALAQGGTAPGPPGWNRVDMDTVFTSIFDFVFKVLIWAAAIALVLAGFFFVTAQGDPEKVKVARNFVLWALVGVAVALLSKALIWLVSEIFPTGTEF